LTMPQQPNYPPSYGATATGAYPPGYNPPQQQQYYGAPQPPQPMQGQQPPYQQHGYAPPQAMPSPEQVIWSGLEQGAAAKIPLTRWIGRFDSYGFDSAFGNLRVVEKFVQVQVLETTAPWPYATCDVPIKISTKEDSGFGRHITSIKALGLTLRAKTLKEAMDELIGKTFEVVKVMESYGENRAGEAMQGEVVRFVRIIQVGGVSMGQQQSPTMMQQPQYMAQPPVMQQYAPPTPQYAPAPAPAPRPVVQTTAEFDTNPSPTDTPSIRAKKLLHGKTLNEFLGVALLDDVVKDPQFINSVFDQSFLVTLKASGQVVEEGGIYKVVKW